jgi:hypothetical protein
MNLLSTFHLKQWVRENQGLFNPPFRTNKLLVSHKDFIVMMLRGPNTRLDFHIDPGDEFFYQVEGEMELVVKPEGERRQIVKIPAQVTAVYTEFNNDPRLRTCKSCGYVFPETPMAERLSFLEKS